MVFAIIRGTPLGGATHVMASLVKAEKRPIYSTAPFLFEHNKLEIEELAGIRNSVVALDFPGELLTTAPELSPEKKELLLAVHQSKYMRNVIYVTSTSTFPIDERFYVLCDYFIFCYPFSSGLVKFSMVNMRNGGETVYFNLNVLATKRMLAYLPIEGAR